MSNSSQNPQVSPSPSTSTSSPKRTGFYFECPQDLLDRFTAKLSQLNALISTQSQPYYRRPYKLTRRDILTSLLLKWLDTPLQQLENSNQPALDHTSPSLATPPPIYSDRTTSLHHGAISATSPTPLRTADELIGNLQDDLALRQNIGSGVVVDFLIDDKEVKRASRPTIVRGSAAIERGIVDRLRAYPAGEPTKLLKNVREQFYIHMPAITTYIDEGGNFYSKDGLPWDEVENCWFMPIGYSLWDMTIVRAWIKGWRPDVWKNWYDLVIEECRSRLNVKFDDLINKDSVDKVDQDEKSLVMSMLADDSADSAPTLNDSAAESATTEQKPLTFPLKQSDNPACLRAFLTDMLNIRQQLLKQTQALALVSPKE